MSTTPEPPPFLLDPAGGPMMWLPKTSAYVHLLPVTKLQFEAYICARPSSQFDQKWYGDLLDWDPKDDRTTARVSPYALQKANYYQAFLTAIRPDEARVYARWCGEEDPLGRYFLPTAEQWWQAYEEAGAMAAGKGWDKPAGVLAAAGLTPTTRMAALLNGLADIVEQLYRAAKKPRTMAEHMLFRHGVMEWVHLQHPGQTEWGGYGQPCDRLPSDMISSLAQRMPTEQRNALTARQLGYGFRLFREAN